MAARRRQRRSGGHGDAEHEDGERWLLTYADMITLLMALFMVFFSISSVNVSKVKALQQSLQQAFAGGVLPGGKALLQTGGDSRSDKVGQTPATTLPAALTGADGAQAQRVAMRYVKEQENFNALKRRIDAYAKRHHIASKVKTTVGARGLKVRILTDKLLFDSGQATVRGAARQLLAKIGRLLAVESHHAVQVRGFTDPVPIHTAAFPTNWELSVARAASVVRSFIAAGVHPNRLEAAGRAQLDPITSNSTPAGRARNRRVEILLPRQALLNPGPRIAP